MQGMTANQEYLMAFFREKRLETRTYSVEVDGDTHMIDTETVIDLIMKAPEKEQQSIIAMLRQIDFANGDVHHFLKHLARCFAKTWGASKR